ncbi:MAG TPA: MarP family serine protease [Candidatus Saccharimonadales bacterium]|nr:MarP family serine protease [Candidatus Saccharimonadales bacterium]
MNWLDVFIVLFLVTALIRGVEVGFIRQFCSTVGFFGGLFLGAFIEGKLVGLAHSANGKAVLALLVIGGIAAILWGIGEYVGLRLKFVIGDGNIADRLDRIFGSALAGVTLLAAIWLGTAVFRNVPDSLWQQQIRSSRIVGFLNGQLPSAPNVLTSIGHFIDPNSFPQVFTGIEPSVETDAPLPDMGTLNKAVTASRPSVVKVEGKGCGGIIEGTGFVAGAHEVVTNAHVVAGVRQPFVADQNGVHRATVISFDPDLDVAVLRTSDLAGKPLNILTQTASNGTAAAVLGYPGGGGFTATPAAILESFTALGRNIYNQGQTRRDIYSIKSSIEQGNSGGPVIAEDGSVIGLVFAKSTTYGNVGYALTMQPVASEINNVRGSNTPVSTGSCAD